MTTPINPPVLPAPAPKYDRVNEAQFRAALERALREIIAAIRELEGAS